MAPFDRLHTSSYSSPIITMAVFCIVFEINRDILVERCQFFMPLVFNLYDLVETIRIFPKILIQTESFNY